MHPALFFIFGGIALAGAINLLVQRAPIYSALSLVAVMGALAVLFLLLGAEFIAFIQVIVYAGAIMVLFVFVIMLVNLDLSLHLIQFNRMKFVATVLAVVLAAQVLGAFWVSRSSIGLGPAVSVTPQNTEAVGQALFGPYMLPFEIASILLLVAMIGAVVMGKRRI